jgi:hypothetical protein
MVQLFSIEFINICVYTETVTWTLYLKVSLKLMMGRIWAENNADGKGATLMFTLSIIDSSWAREHNN